MYFFPLFSGATTVRAVPLQFLSPLLRLCCSDTVNPGEERRPLALVSQLVGGIVSLVSQRKLECFHSQL